MTTIALSDLRRDEALQQRLRDAHWKAPESSKALGVAEAMQAVPDPFNSYGYDPFGPEAGAGFREKFEALFQQVVIKEETK